MASTSGCFGPAAQRMTWLGGVAFSRLLALLEGCGKRLNWLRKQAIHWLAMLVEATWGEHGFNTDPRLALTLVPASQRKDPALQELPPAGQTGTERNTKREHKHNTNQTKHNKT